MSTHAILNENWSDYDDRKKTGGPDRRKFSCTESWERTYLINKIHSLHPDVSKERIEAAINACCNDSNVSRERDAFVECVMRRLGLH